MAVLFGWVDPCLYLTVSPSHQSYTNEFGLCCLQKAHVDQSSHPKNSVLQVVAGQVGSLYQLAYDGPGLD